MNDRKLLIWLIEKLLAVYEETPSEKVLQIVNHLRKLVRNGETIEAKAQEQEFLKALTMIDELPHAQRTWLLYYRDKDRE